MVPFVVMLVVLLVCRGLGALGLSIFATWQLATAVALAVMFLFTATSHFAPMKEDLIKMVPHGLPYPRQVVLVTGVLEILGAIGLLLPATRIAASSAWEESHAALDAPADAVNLDCASAVDGVDDPLISAELSNLNPC